MSLKVEGRKFKKMAENDLGGREYSKKKISLTPIFYVHFLFNSIFDPLYLMRF